MTILVAATRNCIGRPRRLVVVTPQCCWWRRIRFLSSNKTIDSNFQNDEENDPPSKNVGTVVGAWVFCRHGDRTPSRPLVSEQMQAQESHFWLTKLPYPSTAKAYKDFSASFPPLIDDPTGHYMDVHRNPYGFVTHKGLLQMQANGRALRQRYDLNVHALASDEHFLKTWRIAAYSTNYLRTVLSVQSFLDGLLHTNLYSPESTRENKDFTRMAPREWPVPDHNFIPTQYYDEDDQEAQAFEDEGYGSDWEADPAHNVLNLYLERDQPATQRKPKVFVRVRDQSCDNLNAFDRNPDLMRDLVAEVMQSPSFQHHDATAAPIAARLANILPGLARKGRKDFSATTPSGINWVEAADHFVCRTSHDLPLSQFTDTSIDANVEQILSAMTYKALGHLAWRFRQWYQNPHLLAAIAAPPLREIAQQLEHLTKATSHRVRALQDPRTNFLCIYSCHDVTILSLLYALGADFLADETSAAWREYWPEYASTLVIELVKLEFPEQDEDNNHGRHVMRVLINGRVVTSTDFMLSKFEREKTRRTEDDDTEEDEEQPPCNTLGNGPYNLLTTQDFWNIITQLESMGEYDFARWPAMKEESAPAAKEPKQQGRQQSLRSSSLNSSLN